MFPHLQRSSQEYVVLTYDFHSFLSVADINELVIP